MKRKALPFQLEIPKPCDQSWSRMTGNAQQRHCDSCNKQVHNLAALTPAQIERLIHDSNGDLCAHVVRDHQGELITAPMTQRRPFLAAGLTFGAFVSTPLAALGQSSPNIKAIVTGKVIPPENIERPEFIISMSQQGQVIASTLSDATGSWRSELPPGSYDVKIVGLVNGDELNVPNVQFHSGEQDFGPMHVHQSYLVTTDGELVANYSFASKLRYRLRHPIRYISYLISR